jgi:hypothetical protein
MNARSTKCHSFSLSAYFPNTPNTYHLPGEEEVKQRGKIMIMTEDSPWTKKLLNLPACKWLKFSSLDILRLRGKSF